MSFKIQVPNATDDNGMSSICKRISLDEGMFGWRKETEIRYSIVSLLQKDG